MNDSMKKSGFTRGLACILVALTVFVFGGCGLLGTTVNNDKPAVYIDQSVLELEVGQMAQLQAVSTDGSDIIWVSGNESVATVVDGLVMAVGLGECVIVATTDHAMDTCTVTVKPSQSSDDDDPVAKMGYKLVWCDEFNGTALDTNKWGYQLGVQDHYGDSVGPMYWGNGELQYYTQDAVTVADGMLQITATRQDMPDDRTYSSARILTRNKACWTYGYFEARIKTPTGNGMWPAFWMLPEPTNTSNSNNIYGGWPAGGEIDIMEAKGRLLNRVDTTLHFGGAWYEHDYVGKSTKLVSNTDEWHTYALEWTADYMTWYIDGQDVFTVSKSRWWTQEKGNKGQSKPFDQPFYILLDLAVGGQYDNYVEPDEGFTSATMYVDYVRVYTKI